MSDAMPGSPLARLREIRESFKGERHIDLDVPGYQGILVARYQPVLWETLKKIGKRAEKSKANPEFEVLAAADTLAHACIGMYCREEDGSLTEVTFEGEPCRYDHGLASHLGFDEPSLTVRQIVRATFPDSLALVAHYGDVMEWQAGVEQEADAALEEDDEVFRPTSASSPTALSSE